MKIPKVFISYSHDSEAHEEWVLNLGEALIDAGIDVTLDQWDLSLGDDLPYFMEKNITDAEFILVVCTENYVTKANDRIGGVGYETRIFSSDFLQSIKQNKVIPIVRERGDPVVPTFLLSRLYIDLSNDQNFASKLDELIRKIHNSPLKKKPTLGTRNRTNASHSPEQNKSMGILEFLSTINQIGEKFKRPWAREQEIREETGLSNIELEKLIKEAFEMGYIEIGLKGNLHFTKEGLIFLGIT